MNRNSTNQQTVAKVAETLRRWRAGRDELQATPVESPRIEARLAEMSALNAEVLAMIPVIEALAEGN